MQHCEVLFLQIFMRHYSFFEVGMDTEAPGTSYWITYTSAISFYEYLATVGDLAGVTRFKG